MIAVLVHFKHREQSFCHLGGRVYAYMLLETIHIGSFSRPSTHSHGLQPIDKLVAQIAHMPYIATTPREAFTSILKALLPSQYIGS